MVAQIAEPLARFDMLADMPGGLSSLDALAYRLGYNRGCALYVKKNGGPGVVHDGPAPAAGTAERRALGAQLAELTRTHEIARHPAAHRAGMSSLNRSRKGRGLEPIADPCKPAPKTRAPRNLAAVPDSVDQAPAPKKTRAPRKSAPVAAPAPVAPAEETRHNRTRRLARRELADQMRARGEDPRDAAAWAAAKLAAGVK